MNEILFAEKARQDLRNIAANPRWSQSQRQAYITQMRESIRRLRQFPEMGRQRDELSPPGYRSLVHKAHVVIYRNTENTVIIIRVLDGRQDIIATIGEEEKRAFEALAAMVARSANITP